MCIGKKCIKQKIKHPAEFEPKIYNLAVDMLKYQATQVGNEI
jgi:hypothetical protein